jgi:hypothetical protein
MFNKSVKPFVALLLTRTSGAPRLLAYGFAILAQTPLHTSRRLPRRYGRQSQDGFKAPEVVDSRI